ncbi:hypothetical protein trd_1702 [Thermomicrobium roseum DSM 5159]|uniref:Uncharacterized protein n=1 Tax=Thermomicrobium roseum (strain ATCC 27502 / DSM 5159 / P-2) TaxID=309801 RepID=B9L0Z2_THERP|nr:hypothetical protein trd_1702 [Thermomicrobium roseum DSM 5159]
METGDRSDRTSREYWSFRRLADDQGMGLRTEETRKDRSARSF